MSNFQGLSFLGKYWHYWDDNLNLKRAEINVSFFASDNVL